MSRDLSPSQVILKQLQAAEAETRKMHIEAKRTAKRLADELAKLEAAREAFQSHAPATTQSRTQGPTGAMDLDDKRSQGPSHAELTKLVDQVLRRHGPAPKQEILVEIARLLEKKGRSRSGVHLRLARVLREGPFREMHEGWTALGSTV